MEVYHGTIKPIKTPIVFGDAALTVLSFIGSKVIFVYFAVQFINFLADFSEI